jgi:hypothetical protein
MKVLFAALHLGYFRNFESVVRELAARGHQVHLTGDEPEAMGGEALAMRLAAEYPRQVTWDRLPSLEDEPWYDGARRMRVALDYVRALDPRYPPKLRIRAEERTARIVRWLSRLPGGARATLTALKRLERLMPVSERLIDYLRRQSPDVVVLTSLTYSRSQQLDLLKAARALRVPVAAAIMSWDHLSSKALLHLVPDSVIVWNDTQKREAIDLHGIPADRVMVTGAQCYDQWFTRMPERTREAFCRAVGLRPDRPFVLWVHSALSPTPDPPEPILVKRWIERIRASADPRLRDAGILVRPHPERRKEWSGISFDGIDNVAFHGGNPIDRGSKNDYFDSLYYSSAVIGLVTSAFLEAAIVGRPVLTFTLPEYRMHQQEMIHFRYLTEIEGGLLHLAPDLDTHLAQLAGAIALDGARDDRNRRFLRSFIRPAGLAVAATPAFADALERVREAGPAADGAVDDGWLRPIAVGAASWSRTGVGRWLMNDLRADASDDRAGYTDRRLREKRAARDARVQQKVRRKTWRRRREALLFKAREARRALRTMRFRTAMAAHRVLGGAGADRGDLPGGKE